MQEGTGHVPGHVCSGVGHQRHLLASQHRVLVNLHGLCTEGDTQHPTPRPRDGAAWPGAFREREAALTVRISQVSPSAPH